MSSCSNCEAGGHVENVSHVFQQADRASSKLSRGRDRQFVATLVLRMPAVSFDDGEAHAMLREQSIQPLPEFDILDRHPTCAVFALPTVLLPIGHPTGAAVGDILAVGDDLDGRRSRERFQPGDDGHHFHLIVGRVRGSTREFFLGAGRSMPQNTAPTTGARVAAARAIREELDFGGGGFAGHGWT